MINNELINTEFLRTAIPLFTLFFSLLSIIKIHTKRIESKIDKIENKIDKIDKIENKIDKMINNEIKSEN